MRQGEIMALQIGDFTDRGISVERRVYGGQIDTPKSYKSRRVIPPTPVTRDVLLSYIELIGRSDPRRGCFRPRMEKRPSATGTCTSGAFGPRGVRSAWQALTFRYCGEPGSQSSARSRRTHTFARGLPVTASMFTKTNTDRAIGKPIYAQWRDSESILCNDFDLAGSVRLPRTKLF